MISYGIQLFASLCGTCGLNGARGSPAHELKKDLSCNKSGAKGMTGKRASGASFHRFPKASNRAGASSF